MVCIYTGMGLHCHYKVNLDLFYQAMSLCNYTKDVWLWYLFLLRVHLMYGILAFILKYDRPYQKYYLHTTWVIKTHQLTTDLSKKTWPSIIQWLIFKTCWQYHHNKTNSCSTSTYIFPTLQRVAIWGVLYVCCMWVSGWAQTSIYLRFGYWPGDGYQRASSYSWLVSGLVMLDQNFIDNTRKNKSSIFTFCNSIRGNRTGTLTTLIKKS